MSIDLLPRTPLMAGGPGQHFPSRGGPEIESAPADRGQPVGVGEDRPASSTEARRDEAAAPFPFADDCPPDSPAFYPDGLEASSGSYRIDGETAARAYAAWNPAAGLVHLAVQLRRLEHDREGTEEELFDICHGILRRALLSGHIAWGGRTGEYRRVG